MAGRILVGTTSWAEKTLIECGKFYPPSVKSPEDRLRFYASRFPITEVDSTYYGLPREAPARAWAERTPDTFVFDVKAFRLFTRHRTPLSALPRDVRDELPPTDKDNLYYDDVPAELRDELWRRFRAGVAPLRDAGKLGVVLLQYAPWFVFRSSSLDFIDECAARLEGFRVAVELRNKSWLGPKHRDDVIRFLRVANLVHVVTDEPQGFPSSVPPVWAVTVPEVAVVRLHGRNRERWADKTTKTAAERFDYLYSHGELKALAGSIEHLAQDAGEVHVLFNNCQDDKAQRNAATMRGLLGDG